MLNKILLAIAVAILSLSLTGRPGLTGIFPIEAVWSSTLLCGLSSIALLARRGGGFSLSSSFILVLLASSALGLHSSLCVYETQLALAAVIGFAGLYFVCSSAIRSGREWNQFVLVLVSIIFLSNLHALYVYLLDLNPLRGTFTNPDCYSQLCLVGFFLSLGLLTSTASGTLRALYFFPVLVSATSILLTGSRSGMVGLGAGYLALLAQLVASKQKANRDQAIRLAIAPSIAIIAISVLGTDLAITSKLAALGEGRDPVAIKSRVDVVRYGSKTMARYALGGSGLSCFPKAYQQDRPSLLPGEDYMNAAHNDFVQWYVETGVLGGSAFVGLFFFLIFAAVKKSKTSGPIAACYASSLISTAVFMLFNPVTPVPTLLLWLGALFGLGDSLSHLDQDDTDSPRSWKLFLPALLLLCAATWGLQVGWNEFRCVALENKAKALASVLDFESAVEALKEARKIAPQDSRRSVELAQICRRAYLITRDEDWLNQEESAYAQALNTDGRNLSILLKYAILLEESGRVTQAREVLDSAVRFAPYSPHVRRGLVRNLIFDGHLNEAAAQLVSLEKSGLPIDDLALGHLVYLMEVRQSKSGLPYLKKLSSSRLKSVVLALLSRKGLESQVTARVFSLAAARLPEDLDIAFAGVEIARSEQEAISRLEKIRQNPKVSQNDEFERKVWQRWVELRVKGKQYALVQAQMEDFLLSHSRENWARVVLCQAHLAQGHRSEARAALRGGFSNDEDGSLRVMLGDLCVQQRLPDLARSYYREALPFVKDKAGLQERINRLPVSDQTSVPGEEAP